MGLFNLDKIKDMIYVDDPYNEIGEEEVNETKEEGTPAPAAPEQAAPVTKFKVVKPTTFANVTEIADHLLDGCTVVLNLEMTDAVSSGRMIDFLAGVAYAIDGQLKCVSNSIYVITPANVDVDEAPVRTSEIDQNSINQMTNTNINLTRDTLF